jgi:hypothetical protein
VSDQSLTFDSNAELTPQEAHEFGLAEREDITTDTPARFGDQNLCTLLALGPRWARSPGLAKDGAYALVLVILISIFGRSSVHLLWRSRASKYQSRWPELRHMHPLFARPGLLAQHGPRAGKVHRFWSPRLAQPLQSTSSSSSGQQSASSSSGCLPQSSTASSSGSVFQPSASGSSWSSRFSTKVGIRDFEYAKTGKSSCHLCDEVIAARSLRFQYFWNEKKPSKWIHPECVCRTVRAAEH